MPEAPIARWPATEGLTIATDQWTAPFWQAASEHRLVVQRCGDCQHLRMPPSPFCPKCRSQRCEWPEATGDATLYSFTVVTASVTPRQAQHVPYVPAIVEFSDMPGVRLISNIVDAPIDAIAIGARLDLVWQDREDGPSLPRFRLLSCQHGRS